MIVGRLLEIQEYKKLGMEVTEQYLKENAHLFNVIIDKWVIKN